MSRFTAAERAFLAERRLARLATVGPDGTPHVVPVGMWRHDPQYDCLDITGRDFAATKKFRDVTATGRAALVIDDLASITPWRPRGLEVRGRAEAIREEERALIRIYPERINSWGLEPG